MELFVNPKHPVAEAVGSSPESFPVGAGGSAEEDPTARCGCFYNDDQHTTAECPYADDDNVPGSRAFRDKWGDATDVTHHYYDATSGHLLDPVTGRDLN